MRYLIICLLLFGCSVAKKDQRALNRVKADINLLNDAGQQWAQLNPCKIDTLVQFKPGTPVIRYNTLYQVDTVFRKDTVVITKTRTVEKEINNTDTQRIYVTDNRLERQLTTALAKAEGSIIEKDKQLKELKSESTKKTWWLIGAGVLIVGLIVLLFKRK